MLVGVAIGGERLTARLSPTIAENVGRINDQALANIGGLGAAAVAAILLGIGEEVLFRGAIQPRYGVFLTALAFAALHTQYGFPAAPLTALRHRPRARHRTTLHQYHRVYPFARTLC